MLSDLITSLRGPRSLPKLAKACGLSMRTVAGLSRGESVRLNTLRQIASKCHCSDSQWKELLLAWIRLEIGEEDFQNLDIQAATTNSDTKKLINQFSRLNTDDQASVLKTLERRELLNCLADLNKVYDNLAKPTKRKP